MTSLVERSDPTSPVSSITQERRLVTAVPGPRSAELGSRVSAAVSGAVKTTLPAAIVAAKGAVLLDADGNQLIDLGSGIAVTTVGHAAPRVVERASAQLPAFTHTCFMVTPYEGYVAVCEQLNRLTPGDGAKRSVLVNSGAEAVENAVKIARAATGRPAVAVFDHAYHGRTNLTMALTSKAVPYKQSFGPFAPEVYRAPMSYPFREPVPISGEQAAQRAITLLDKQVGASSLAAVVIEPIQGEGGFVVPAPGFLPTLAQWCSQHGVLLVADEIQTGFGRTGAWFACEHEGVVPDLITTAKGIAGGLPLAGVTGRADVMDAVHVGGLGGTYGGNPVSCAAALGAIETIESDGLLARARDIDALMRPRLEDLARRHRSVGDVRGRGAMLAVELVRPGTTEPDPSLTSAVAAACHRRGVVVLTAGTFGNVLRFLPPLVIGEDLLADALDVIDEAFAEVAAPATTTA